MPTYAFFHHDRFRHALAILAPLGVGQCRLFGHIAHLERWMCNYCTDGDLTGVDDERLEFAAGWTFPEVPDEWAGQLASALRRSGLIHEEEGRVLFRGWPESAPDFVKKRIKRTDEKRRRAETADHQRRTTSANGGQRRTTADNGGQRRPVGGGGRLERRGEEREEEECARALRASELESDRVKPRTSARASATAAGGTPAAFPDDQAAAEAIYEAYPRHVAKDAALRAACAAIAAIRDRGVPEPGSWLLGRVRAFARSPAGQAGRFTPHPATWLRAARYDDDDREWETRDDHAAANGSDRVARVQAPADKYAWIDGDPGKRR